MEVLERCLDLVLVDVVQWLRGTAAVLGGQLDDLKTDGLDDLRGLFQPW